jgi:stage V sporulation protein AD
VALMGHVGKQTVVYERRPYVKSCASIAGPKEGQGPMGGCFDAVMQDDLLGKESWELAESEMTRIVVEKAAEAGGAALSNIEAFFCGDLINQIFPSAFAGRATGMPFIGMYGACSTMIETMLTAAALVDGAYLGSAVCASSSHFCTAERQYRQPLEHGNQRPPSAQWTATAAGAVLLLAEADAAMARVKNGTIGRVIDFGVTDANHMGAAMAPSVADTITALFSDTGTGAADYDVIVTGDLGHIGRALLLELMKQRGLPLAEEKYFDCGDMIFGQDEKAKAGGSGCGCVASILAGHFLPLLQSGALKNAVVVGSGAMLSPTSAMQGQSIPCISYAVTLEGNA